MGTGEHNEGNEGKKEEGFEQGRLWVEIGRDELPFINPVYKFLFR